MKKITLSIGTIAMVCCMGLHAFAQHDPAWLDAGTLKLNSVFTQTISIKGEELEKMPFANLGEAIGAWLYGIYSNPLNLVYVVDGIPVADVNGYSIYDIEEIVLVQSALVKVNGAPGQGQMVLIKTRKKASSPLGVTVGLQSALVGRDFGQFYPGSSIGSKIGGYDQFYAGLNRHEKNIDYGLSFDYLRDVLPSAKADSIQSANSFVLSRFRLNGYVDLRLGEKNTLSVHVNYTPQTMDSSQQYYANSFLVNGSNDYPVPTFGATQQHQYSFSSWASWRSEISDRWENELQGGYLFYRNRINGQLNDNDTFVQPPSPQVTTDFGYGNQRSEHIYGRDRLSYTVRAGGWDIRPSLNLSFEHISDKLESDIRFVQAIRSDRGAQFYMTPSVDIGYKGMLDIQGGLLADLSSQHVTQGPIEHIYPFVSVAANVLEGGGRDSVSSLKLFASYAKMTDLANDDYALPDLANEAFVSSPTNFAPSAYYGNGIPGAELNGTITNVSSYSSSDWEAGAGYATADRRVQVNYHFARTKFLAFYISNGFLAQGIYSYGFGDYLGVTASTNYLGIQLPVVKARDGAMDWQSGINFTIIGLDINQPYAEVSSYQATADPHGNTSWTGGWTNRLRFGRFSMGFNFLYHFHESANPFYLYNPGAIPSIVNSIVLQNLWLGYRLRLSGGHHAEVFLNSRNLFQSSYSDVTDGRRYYGIGGKIGI